MRRVPEALLLAIVAASPARAAFERVPTDASSAARGGLVAVSEDAVWGNPAGAALEPDRGGGAHPGDTRLQVAFDGSQPFGLAELTEGQAGLLVVRRFGCLGAGIRRFGAEFYSEREARLVVSAVRSGTALGVAVRGLEVGGEGFASRRSVVVDASMAARAGSLDVGATLEAVTGSVPGDPRRPSRRAALGVARGLAPSLRLLLEIQRRGEGPLATVVGLAWRPAPSLRLHAGARQDPPVLGWGFSVGGPALRVDAAAEHLDPVGTTLRLGVRLGFGRAGAEGTPTPASRSPD